MFRFELGSKVRCIVTGFSGIVTGRAEYLNGCITYSVKPPIDDKGKMVNAAWLDEPQLEIVDLGLSEVRRQWPAAGGGPREDEAPER